MLGAHMIRRLTFAAVLLLLLTSRAQAATIDLVLTINHYAPTVGSPEITLDFSFFESATNGWTTSFPPQPYLASVTRGALLPGVTQYLVSLDALSLDNIYFIGYGLYDSAGRFHDPSIYVAEPPTGSVPDILAYQHGPPWIPLANLGGGFSGDLQTIYGSYRGPIGTPVGTWELTPVPEPASLLLFGSGLAAIAVRRYRKFKA